MKFPEATAGFSSTSAHCVLTDMLSPFVLGIARVWWALSAARVKSVAAAAANRTREHAVV